MPRKQYRPFRFNVPGGKHCKRRSYQSKVSTVDKSVSSGVPTASVRFNPNLQYTVKANDLKHTFKQNKPKHNLSGYRVFNLSMLADHISSLTKHVLMCPMACSLNKDAPLKLLGEVKRWGLHTVQEVECSGCFKRFTFGSSPKLPTKDSFR